MSPIKVGARMEWFAPFRWPYEVGGEIEPAYFEVSSHIGEDNFVGAGDTPDEAMADLIGQFEAAPDFLVSAPPPDYLLTGEKPDRLIDEDDDVDEDVVEQAELIELALGDE